MTGLDFGRDNPGKVGDTVWNDANGNGVQDGGETGIPGVTLSLYNITGTLLDNLVTDSNGNYTFIGLPDGVYTVTVDASTVPTGFVQTGDPEANNDGQGVATVSGGGYDDSMDFGYQLNTPTYGVSGLIWEDLDGNGIRNPITETTVFSDVLVTVSYTNTNGTPISVTVQTNSSGVYSVTGIPDNREVLISVDPSTLPATNYAQTGDPDGVPPADNKTVVSISGASVPDQDFGYQQQFG
ncbi:MAG: hypothetical protein HC802_18830 [Caldilineaceae bacterium]|nr:hypothetical protein [Caldilineaceae bacterium]